MAKHPPGQPMTLANMRDLGVKRLLASCLNDACRHQALIDVSSYPGDTEVPSFQRRAKTDAPLARPGIRRPGLTQRQKRVRMPSTNGGGR